MARTARTGGRIGPLPLSTSNGLVLRTVYPTVPAQVDYRLTETGTSLTHLVQALADWSLAHRDAISSARHEYDVDHLGNEIH